jgi:hypothetical protein
MLASKDCQQMDARLARRDAGITHVTFRGQRLRSVKPPGKVTPRVRVARFALALTRDLLRGMEPGLGFGFTRQ